MDLGTEDTRPRAQVWFEGAADHLPRNHQLSQGGCPAEAQALSTACLSLRGTYCMHYLKDWEDIPLNYFLWLGAKTDNLQLEMHSFDFSILCLLSKVMLLGMATLNTN